MACTHKFQSDLELSKLDFLPTTLIVGTFNPSWPASNCAEWFYGRTQNNHFWEVLPRLYQEPSLISASPAAWKAFCQRHLIAITDLIASIEDADSENQEHHNWLKDYSDTKLAQKFKEHQWVCIKSLLQQHPSIRNVYFTRGVGAAFWRQRWQPVAEYAATHGIHCRTLLTPSGNARFQFSAAYKQEHPVASLADFILSRWQEHWHEAPSI